MSIPTMRALLTIAEGAGKSARPSSRRDADERLRAAGYRRLGDAGSFGAVYQKPGKSFVLKVFDANDVPYMAFVALAQAHPDNPHFPKFYRTLVRVTPMYNAIRMEPLTPYTYDPTLIYNYLKLRDYKPNDPQDYVAMQREDALEFMEFQPTLGQACDLIIDHLLPTYTLDIKQNNLMTRGTTIVITDPVKDLTRFPASDEHLPYVPPEPEPEPPLSAAAQAERDAEIDKLLADLFGPDHDKK